MPRRVDALRRRAYSQSSGARFPLVRMASLFPRPGIRLQQTTAEHHAHDGVDMTSGRAEARAVDRVAIAGTSDLALLRNRDSLIRELVARRKIVLCIAPSFEPDHRRALNLMGAETIAFDPPPGRFRLLDDWQRRKLLANVLADWKPDAVLGVGTAAMTEALLAAKHARIPRTVALLNVPLDSHDTAARPVPARRLADALAVADAIVAHNPQLARQARALAGPKAKATWAVVPGAGVDLMHHTSAPLPPIEGGLVFLMIAPLDARRGVLDFAEAARQIRGHGRRARFQLVATPSTAADAIPRDALAPYAADLDVLDPVEDIRPLLARCHVYVYPSRAEGLPRSVLEALAAGRPVITTDIPGCREAIDERVNGCLVPPHDAGALTLAIESVLKRPDLIPSQARASRLKAERNFDVRDVNRTLLAALGIA